MNLNYLSDGMRKKVLALIEDEEFQKLFAEDNVLNELQGKQNEKMLDYRMCQLVVDYLISKKKINRHLRSFWLDVLQSEFRG